MNLPESKEWNHYWSLDKTSRFTKVSWSKRRMMQILNKYVNRGDCALDAGCGSGFFSKYFCDVGMKTTSIDYSDQALEITKLSTSNRSQILKVNLLSENLSERLGDKFSLIFTDGLFEHFSAEEQDTILKNLMSVLSHHGSIITFVPNRWSPWELIRPFYMPGIEEKPFVFKGLLDLNERNELMVIDSGGINTAPFFLSPDNLIGKRFGMLLYTASKLKS